MQVAPNGGIAKKNVVCTRHNMPNYALSTLIFRTVLVVLLLGAIGCTTNEPCTTLACVKQLAQKEAAKPYYDQCMSDLNFYPQLRKRERDRIDATYYYPLTSAESYHNWMSLGASGPSPFSWSNKYSRFMVKAPS